MAKQKKEELSEQELDQVKGGALLLPAVQAAREAARSTTPTVKTNTQLKTFASPDDQTN
ncbi:hypothetical protein [Parasphingopyxis marina]|uniref:Bacteriocin n=1 Tax=Parasphingopyxis marina TaxID=2761622 RepID=A0A842HT60_9SPHN|nr:hypothetical protein [Parasphingopyxis marina]MBC2777068.1 hypothetical protein [Parasphingopyxis marina]